MKNMIYLLPYCHLFSINFITISFISLLLFLLLSKWLKTFYCSFIGYMISTLFNILLFLNLFIFNLLSFINILFIS